MNTLRGWITTTFLATSLLLSTMPANAGVIISNRSDSPSPCTLPGTTKLEIKSDLGGVIIGGLTGVIIGGLTGVIIGGAIDGPVDCGVIIGG